MTNTMVTNGNGHGKPQTFRGKTLEEALAQVREQIGGEALVLRRREGLMGGVGGFFARPFVEVEAIAPPRVDTHDGEAIDPPLGAPADPSDGSRAGSGDPQAAPDDSHGADDSASFAALLDELNATFDAVPGLPADPPLEWADQPAQAELTPPAGVERAAEPKPEPEFPPLVVDPHAGVEPAAEPAPEFPPLAPWAPAAEPAGPTAPAAWQAEPAAWEAAPPPGELARPAAWTAGPPAVPQPPAPQLERAWLAEPHPAPAAEPVARPAFTEPTLLPAPTPVAKPGAAGATPALAGEAADIAATLVAAGLEQALAHEVVAEAVSHRAPFSPRTGLRKLVGRALAGRIPTAHAAPAGPRVVAFVGAGGAGKTTCVELLAAAYAARSDLAVVCLAFETPGADLARRLKPHGVPVIEVTGTAEARAAIARLRDHALVVIDTPAPAPGDLSGAQALATRLKRIGAVEVQLALPVTVGGRAAEALVERFAPFRPRRLALTHVDDVSHGAPALALAIRHQLPLSYVVEPAGGGCSMALADPERLAAGALR